MSFALWKVVRWLAHHQDQNDSEEYSYREKERKRRNKVTRNWISLSSCRCLSVECDNIYTSSLWASHRRVVGGTSVNPSDDLEIEFLSSWRLQRIDSPGTRSENARIFRTEGNGEYSTVAGELIRTLHGRTATPPRCAMMLVLFLVVNIDRLSTELSTAPALVSGTGEGKGRTIKFVGTRCHTAVQVHRNRRCKSEREREKLGWGKSYRLCYLLAFQCICSKEPSNRKLSF